MDLKDLTKVESQLMQLLWNLGKAFVKEIIKELLEPPACWTA
jgi:BlaI family penicillinase repressor